MLYVQLKKALQVTLLFWKLLSETLQEWGFTLNPYDKCIANKNIPGKQCAIIWHVDDFIQKERSSGRYTKKLNDKFGQESPLPTCWGKVLEYLGIKINYRQQGKVKLTMYDYVK